MQNKRYRDTTIVSLPVPATGVVTGKPYAIGGFFGFSQVTKAFDAADNDNLFTLDRSGGFLVTAQAAGAISVGDPIYFLAGRAVAEFTNAPEGRLVGYAMQDFVGGQSSDIVLAAAATGTILVSVEIYPNTTAAEAIEDAGGADA